MTAPADFDAMVDPQIGALLTLCVGAVKANVKLADNSGDQMVSRYYGWAVPRSNFGQSELPALLIYRLRSSTQQRTMLGPLEHKGIYTFEYVMPTTPIGRVDLRWRALELVWEELVRVVALGHDPAVSSDAPILTTAGFMAIDETERGRLVDFQKPDPQRDVMPSFIGTMTLSHRADFDLDALQDLISLDAQFRPTDLPELEQPLVEQILTTP